MANWKYKLNVKNEWQAVKNGDMTIAAFASFAANRLKELNGGRLYEDDQELYDIVEELETIAGDPEPDVEWFDSVWNGLYDWADQQIGGRWTDKMCWIATF